MNRPLPLILVLILSLAAGDQRAGAAAPQTQSHLLTLRRGEAPERESAARLLGASPADAAETVPALLAALKSDRDERVRISVRSALVAIGKPAVPHLVSALGEWPADRKRELVAVLAVVGPDAAAAIPQLQEQLRSNDARLRQSVTFALNNIQPGSAHVPQPPAREAEETPPWTTAGEPTTQEPSPPFTPPVQQAAAANDVAAGKVETLHLEVLAQPDEAATVKPLPPLPLKAIRAAKLKSSRFASKAIESSPPSAGRVRDDVPRNAAAPRESAIRRESSAAWRGAVRLAHSCQFEAVVVLKWIGLAYAGWLFLCVLLPVPLVNADLLLARSRSSLVVRVLLCWIHPVRVLLLLPWLCRSRYAVAAWIDARGEAAVTRFSARPDVQRHAGLVAAPVRWNGEFRARLTGRDLQTLLRRGTLLHVAGPSGSGKTALAVEIAGQALGGIPAGGRRLPVFLRAGMEIAVSIREQVRHLLEIEASSAPHCEPLVARIAERFVLLIVDAIDDPAADREYLREVRQAAGECPVIVTSADAPLPLDAAQRIEPLTPQSDLLAEFVDEYLVRRGCAAQVTDDERQRLCRHAAEPRTAGPLPLLLLTMCLDEFIRSLSNPAARKPAGTVTELIERHLDWQLAKGADFGFAPHELHGDVAELAQMSLAKSFRPQAVRRDAALKHLAGWNAAHRLGCLAGPLALLDVDPGEAATVRFSSGFIAARLAAEQRRASLDLAENRWRDFLLQLRSAARRDAAGVQLFALALYDGCVDSIAPRPEFVLAELAEIAGLPASRAQRDRLEQQARTAAALDDESPHVRLAAVQALGKTGLATVETASDLIKSLVDEDAAVRQAAGAALSQLRGAPERAKYFAGSLASRGARAA